MKRKVHPIYLTQPSSSSLSQKLCRIALGVSFLGLMSLSTACSEESLDSTGYNSTSELNDTYYEDYSQSAGEEAYPHHSDPGSMTNAPNISSDEALEETERSVADQDNTIEVNPEEDASSDNQLTFAVDVDTASYTLARQSLQDGYLPTPSRIRVEEFINFFDYQDEAPENLDESPFAVHLDAAQAPFAENKTLLRIGLKGYEVPNSERPATNLVFLIDTSGSMGDSIELVRQSLGLLLDNLNETDTIAIVTYAGSSEVALRPTSVSNRDDILTAMGSLDAGGSTNGAGGIITAYDLAENAFKQGGLNRVVLCTDGDFNVGVRGQELYDLIEEKREGGITLSVLGFGRHNNDEQMEQLADRGNGNYTFIDSLREAQRALVDRLTATLMVIAKDVKVQLEVNPMIVQTYRLLGYENRAIADHDFRNDSVDAGEIGAGHTVTALVELTLHPLGERPTIESLGAVIAGQDEVTEEVEMTETEEEMTEIEEEMTETEEEMTEIEEEIDTEVERAPLVLDPAFAREDAPLALLRLRNKTPQANAEDPAVEQVHEISESEIREDAKRASKQLMFAAAVAEFAEILRGSPFVDEANFEAVIELAEAGMIEGDEWMTEFIDLVGIARDLYPQP